MNVTTLCRIWTRQNHAMHTNLNSFLITFKVCMYGFIEAFATIEMRIRP